MFKDYYQILGVSPSATKQEIKEAYRKMSMRWHPDKNPDKDVTQTMQDINEAYMILKDDVRRARYDNEYRKFTRRRENIKPMQQDTKSESWDYDYDVDDDDLRNDINAARASAKDLVDEFLKSLRETSKAAVKGGWDGAKGYLYAAIILSILGLCIRGCMETQRDKRISYDDWQSEPIVFEDPIASVKTVPVVEAFQAPNSWTRYYIANKAFSISVPPTVELRHEYDNYVKRLHEMGLFCNTDDIVFQQKELANGSPEALSHYCRVMIQYVKGDENDFPLKKETFPLDSETKAELREIIGIESGPYQPIGEPAYKWISIGETKAIETSYRRTGANNYTTACRMYLLFNSSEMVKIIVSYREQESDMWLPDLTNIIKTFRWK